MPEPYSAQDLPLYLRVDTVSFQIVSAWPVTHDHCTKILLQQRPVWCVIPAKFRQTKILAGHAKAWDLNDYFVTAGQGQCEWLHTNFGTVKGACDPWHAEQFEMVQYISTRTLIFPRPFQESLARSDTGRKREHKILISHNVLQAVIHINDIWFIIENTMTTAKANVWGVFKFLAFCTEIMCPNISAFLQNDSHPLEDSSMWVAFWKI